MPAADRLLDVLQFWSEPEDRDGKLTVWSTCKIDGQFFPGVDSLDDPGACIAVPKARRELVTDKLKPVNRSNSSLVWRGYKPAMIEITVRVWTIAQWRALLQYLPTINPSRKITRTMTTQRTVTVAGPPAPVVVADEKVGASVKEAGAAPTGKTTEAHSIEQIPAHAIEHPDLALLGIASCYFTAIETPEAPEDGGVRTIKIHATEIVRGTKGAPARSVATTSQRLGNDADVLPEFKLDRGPP